MGKHVCEESSALHKTNITVLANVCIDGLIPPPLIIYPRKRISAHMGENFPEDYKCCVGKNEKGYITFETLYMSTFEILLMIGSTMIR